MGARTERRAAAREQARLKPQRPTRWTRWSLLGLVAALLAIAGLATAAAAGHATPPPAIVMPAIPATAPPTSTSSTPIAARMEDPRRAAGPGEWPGWVHGKDEMHLDVDLSEGRGEHKEDLVLARLQPVDVIATDREGATFTITKIVGDLKPGDRVRMNGGRIGLVTANAPAPDKEVPPRGVSLVIGKSERLASAFIDLRTTGETIHVTPEHPIKVKGKGWTEAQKLRPGDVLDASRGAHVEVISLARRNVSPPEKVYNLETWPDHTFLVGNQGILVHNGGCITPPAGATFEVAEGATQGASFSSYGAYQRALGPAGPGQQWHHIVEQNPANLARFGPGPIQNTGNILSVDTAIHRQISGYYSSIDPAISSSMTVRQWVSAQPYAVQQQFGLDILRFHGVVP
jgi:hypothetical protein